MTDTRTQAEIKLWGVEPPTYLQVKLKVTETPRGGQTVSGYGARIPTCYMVEYLGRWRRVYGAQWGNAGSLYIGKRGDWLATVTF